MLKSGVTIVSVVVFETCVPSALLISIGSTQLCVPRPIESRSGLIHVSQIRRRRSCIARRTWRRVMPFRAAYSPTEMRSS
jgi:hypothetical protein